ncbi:hypothetical protein BGZ76_008856 [Entomortierella beljakovae]|nr:hypothetical protein BGZ76_008856 [Entomortierella beljakovae]
MYITALGQYSYSAILCSVALFSPFFLQQTLAQQQVCYDAQICSPLAGDTWTQGSLESIIWNPTWTNPFDQYDRVDIYIVDDTNSVPKLRLQEDIGLEKGMTAVILDNGQLFPTDKPNNRSCHLIIIRNGDDPDSSQTQSISSRSFFLVGNNKSSTTASIIPPITATFTSTTPSLTATTSPTPQSSSSSPTTSSSSSSPIPNGIDNSPPPGASPTSKGALSPLVIGLISAGSFSVIVAIIAVALLLRTRRRYRGDTTDFKSLNDHPSSPTDEASKSSIFKSEDNQDMLSKSSLVGPSMMTAGRSSTHTARSADPMIKEAPSILGYTSMQSSPTTTAVITAPVPLIERKPSAVAVAFNRSSESTTSESEREREEATDDFNSELTPSSSSRGPKGSILSAGDAQLIAETFRKSMRRPRWEQEEDAEEEEDARDATRKAANELLRRELSDRGLDVQRGVQRRVTIQDQNLPSETSPFPQSDTA